MTAPIAYGIDFGTTNSVLAIAWPDRIEVMPGFEPPLLRSAVYMDAGGTRTAGESAIRQFLARPDIEVARLFLELKATLSDLRRDRLDLFGRSERLEVLVAIVLRYLKLLGDRATGYDVKRVVLGFPVAFPDADGPQFDELQSMALERLCSAANLAGFEDVLPLEEPAAAATDEDAELYAALDFGGGTFDVAVVRNDVDAEVLSLTGTPVGGERLTALLFGAVMTPALGLDHPRMPNRHTLRTQSLAGVLYALFADDLPLDVIGHYAPLFADIVRGGFLYDLYEAVEGAKIRLSDTLETTIALRGRGVELAVPVTRDQFERAIVVPLRQIVTETERAIDRAGVTPEDVELVVLTGGSSRIPSFRDLVVKHFPAAQVVDRDPYTLVATGLARQAQEVKW